MNECCLPDDDALGLKRFSSDFMLHFFQVYDEYTYIQKSILKLNDKKISSEATKQSLILVK